MTTKQLFVDSPCLTDRVVLACEYAQSKEEWVFARAIWFHSDFLSGGFEHALENHYDNLDEIIDAYRHLSMDCLANVIVMAEKAVAQWEDNPASDEPGVDDFDAMYLAMCYNLPYACNEYSDDPEFPDSHGDNDWVHRMALKFARAHIDKFITIANAAREAVAS